MVAAAAVPLSGALQLRRIANLVNGSTVVGLGIARLGRARVTPGPGGLLLAEGYRLPFPIAGAFTVGNVVIIPTSLAQLQQSSPRVLEHESRHSWQYVWTGMLFLPLYVVAMAWSMARTGDRAARNIFERWARLADGGYEDVPIRPLRTRIVTLLNRSRPVDED